MYKFPRSNVKEMNAVTSISFMQSVLSANQPVLVDFTADWCPPCKMIAPILQEIAAEYQGKLQVVELDADQNPDVVMAYGVMGLPTLILFVDGAPQVHISGFMPKHKLLAKLSAWL